MSVLTLEVPDKVLEHLRAQAQKAQMTVEELVVSALFKQAKINQLREDVQEGLDALNDGKFTEYASAEEMMDVVRRGIKDRLAQSENNTLR